jgi:hypothetical protein
MNWHWDWLDRLENDPKAEAGAAHNVPSTATKVRH